MRPSYLFTLIAFCIACALSCFAQSAQPFLPITPQDLAIKDVPGNPNAPAVQLYYSYYKDDNNKFELSYRRIKILKDGGKKYADVEIPLFPDDSLKELHARTIHPDGSIVDYTGKPFEKTVIKARGVKFLARTFTFPDVTVGSIVEYSYSVVRGYRRLFEVTEWSLESDLYTLKEHFRFQPYLGFVLVPSEFSSENPKSQSTCSYQNQPGAPLAEKKKSGLLELELENVSPFKAEDYMPPESDYRAEVLCYYGGHEFVSAEKFWPEWQKRITEGTEKFIGNPSSLREAATRAIGSETDPEQKVRKLYAFAQQLRNLSYERERTEKEEKKEKLAPNKSAADVLHHGYGNHWQIDATFAGLLRAAGFEATTALVSDRFERTFNQNILWLGQLSGVTVLVDVDGANMLLDPGTRFCPFGVLPPRYSDSKAVLYKTGGGFFTTAPPPVSSVTRVSDLALSADGSAKGQLTVTMQGPRALQHRLDALDTDEAGRRKDFEDEVGAWLPSGAVVKMIESNGWTSSEEPLTAKFTVEIPALGTPTGKRLIVPAYLLSSIRKNAFTSDFRNYPVYFGYPFDESDQLTLQLPDGYSLEEPPYKRKSELPWAGYDFSSTVDQNKLVIKRGLHLDKYYFETDDYFQLKSLFTIVQAGDSSQAVLQAKQDSSAKP